MEKLEKKVATGEEVKEENKLDGGDTKEIAKEAIKDVESLSASEQAELVELKKLQEKLRRKDLGSKISSMFLSDSEKRIRETGEKFADKFLFKNKKERDFIVRHGAIVQNAIKKGYFTEPSQKEMEAILAEAEADKFGGRIGPDPKTNKAIYVNTKDIKYGSALSGGPSL
ncbi:hypothetical protein KKA39_02975 [Patescibacteria group bacterium]|nr:hypothetical protein [Patescibacteria group bacterium]MBU1728240.1 hypothetical protein [Patescibacteria group bacterium]